MRWTNLAMMVGLTLSVSACGSGDGGPSVGDSVDSADVTAAISAELQSAMGSRETHFESEAALQKELTALALAFKDATARKAAIATYPIASERLDRFTLFLLTRLGKAFVKDQVVLSDTLVLAQSPARAPMADPGPQSALGTSQQALGNPNWEVQQNQGDYKTRGESFVENILAYKQAWAHTQFKKHRKSWGFTGWYDTDASHIAVQVYYFGNPDPGAYPQFSNISYAMSEGADHNTHDDYVSDRQLCYGGTITFGTDRGSDTTRPGVQFNVPCYGGVYALHAVDHAGYKWRLSTSTGLRAQLDWGSINPAWHIPWGS